MIQAPASSKIIHMILRLAVELDIPVVAEGIEEPYQEQALAELGCAFGQGYLFGKPATFEETLVLARQWTIPHAEIIRTKAAKRA